MTHEIDKARQKAKKDKQFPTKEYEEGRKTWTEDFAGYTLTSIRKDIFKQTNLKKQAMMMVKYKREVRDRRARHKKNPAFDVETGRIKKE